MINSELGANPSLADGAIPVEKSLKVAYDSFRQLVERSPFGIYLVDSEFRLTLVSDGAQKVFENVRPLIGRDFAEVMRLLWSEPFSTEAIGRFRHTLATGEPYNSPSTVERRFDIGEIESYDWKIARVTLPDGRFGVVCRFYDLSERHKYEAALLESDQRFKAAIEAADAFVYDVDLLGDRIVTYGLGRLTGYRRQTEAFTMDWWYSTIHPEDLPAHLAVVAKHELIGGRYMSEYRGRNAAGNWRWYSDNALVTLNSDGTPQKIVGTIIDRSVSKKSQAALQESNRLLENVMDAAPVVIYIFNYLTSENELLNRRAAQMLGYDELSWKGKSKKPLELIHPDDVDAVRKHFIQLNGSTSGEPVEIEYRMQHANGNWRWFLSHDIAYNRADDGSLQTVLGAAIDITERKHMENALHDSEERLRLAAKASEFGIYEFDPATKQSVWSGELFAIFGLEPRARMNLSVLFAAVHPDDRQEYQKFQDRPVDESKGGTYEHSYRIVRPTGEVRWVTEKGSVEFESNGGYRQAVKARGTVVDFTQRKQHEEHAELLMREVNHRTKNLLAVVQAVARQTARKSDPRVFAEQFRKRLSGLAASHDLLVQAEWRGVELGELVRSQLAHFADLIGHRITLQGLATNITPSAAQAIGMAIHELATNAGKYGALSNANGIVTVGWQIDQQQTTPRFEILWTELGGPPCTPPTHHGFGHTVILEMVEHALDAKVTLSYPETGLVW